MHVLPFIVSTRPVIRWLLWFQDNLCLFQDGIGVLPIYRVRHQPLISKLKSGRTDILESVLFGNIINHGQTGMSGLPGKTGDWRLTASVYFGVKSRGDLTYGKAVSGIIVPETQHILVARLRER